MISEFVNCSAGMFECEWTVYGMCEWMMIYEGGGEGWVSESGGSGKILVFAECCWSYERARFIV